MRCFNVDGAETEEDTHEIMFYALRCVFRLFFSVTVYGYSHDLELPRSYDIKINSYAAHHFGHVFLSCFWAHQDLILLPFACDLLNLILRTTPASLALSMVAIFTGKVLVALHALPKYTLLGSFSWPCQHSVSTGICSTSHCADIAGGVR